jgi:hypothetical protein
MYTFNTARIVSPILLVVLAVANRDYLLKKIPKTTILSVIFGAVIFVPLFIFLLTPQAKLRFQEVNIFSDPNIVKLSNQQIKNNENSIVSKVLHNRRVLYGIEFVKHYFDNLSPSFLFIKGDGNPKFSIQSIGQMYIFEIPFLIAGVLFLFRKREGHWWFIPIWIAIGIIPAATARETPHALRIETIVPTLQILVAYGAYHLFKIISDFKTLKIVFLLFLAFAALNVVYFTHTYFVHYSREYSRDWQYGYAETISYIKQNESKYDNIVFTNSLGRPYIYALFYERYSPKSFQEDADIFREALGFVHVNSFGKYKFVDSVRDRINTEENNLYIDKPYDVPEDATILKTFYELDGEPTLVAYEL